MARLERTVASMTEGLLILSTIELGCLLGIGIRVYMIGY